MRGGSQTVTQMIEVLTNSMKNEIEVPENLADTNFTKQP